MLVFGSSALVVLTVWVQEASTVLDAIRSNGTKTRAIRYLLMMCSRKEMVSRLCTMVCKSTCIWSTTTLSTARNVTFPAARQSTQVCSMKSSRRAQFNGFQLEEITAVISGEPTLVSILATEERPDSLLSDQNSCREVLASSIFPLIKRQVL